MVTPQFVSIGANKIVKLDDLVPTGNDVNKDGGINIQLLNAYGVTVAKYQWIDWSADDDVKGWCDSNFELVSNITFDEGQGLWVQGTSSGAALQSAGKVEDSDVTVQLRFGATATGNPFPTSINLQDIVPQGENINKDGGINIQLLNAYGVTTAKYQWIDWSADDDVVGWCDGNFELVTGVTFGPGQGLWVQGTKDTEYLRFPAPEL